MSPAPPASANESPVATRKFWTFAIVLISLLTAALFVSPVIQMLSRASIQYNEGWNAYFQKTAMLGQPLYGVPPGLTTNAYPPLSFYMIGGLGTFTGDVNQTGRWVALFSLLLDAMLCGAIVLFFTRRRRLALCASLSLLLWMAVYKPDRIGMNDPQLLGSVFSLLGLYLYVRRPSGRWLVLSAISFTISVFTKHNLLAFPFAVGLDLLLARRFRNFALWAGTILTLSLLLVAWIYRAEGPYFLASLLAKRTHENYIGAPTDYLTYFQLPIVVAIIWGVRHLAASSQKRVLVLALLLAHLIAFAFANGSGVDLNIFFDCVFLLVIAGSLAFSDFIGVADLKGITSRARPWVLAGLLAAPSLGILIHIPQRLHSSIVELRRLPERVSDFDSAVALVRQQPGNAVCEDVRVCFTAGKPFTYDPFIVTSMAVGSGLLSQTQIVAMFDHKTFGAIQLDGLTLAPGARYRFKAPVVQSILNNYQVEARLHDSLVLIPKR